MADLSPEGAIELYAEEGLVLRAYRDLVDVWTIGPGLTAASGVVKPKAGMVITRDQADQLTRKALERNYEPAVEAALGAVKQNVFDGGVLFHWNTGAIKRASWVTKFKAGQMLAAYQAFLAWNKAGGRVVRGLTNRRKREWDIIAHGKYHHAKIGNLFEAENAAVLKRGDRGEDVERLQEMLIAAGFGEPLGPEGADGIFGDGTDQAVRAFQRAHPQLTLDGKAGTATMTTLQRVIDAGAKAKSQPAKAGTAGTAAGAGGSAAVDPAQGVEQVGNAIGWGIAAGIAAFVLVLAFIAWRYRDEIRARIRRDQ